MSASADRVLELIDAGLQSTDEASYGNDCPDRCVRCLANEPRKDGDLCAPCRSFLLGDTDEDPADSQPIDVAGWRALMSMGTTFEAAGRAMVECLSGLVDAFNAVVEAGVLTSDGELTDAGHDLIAASRLSGGTTT